MRFDGVLYIQDTVRALDFYIEAFGMTLGNNEKFPNGTYMHAELQKDGEMVFVISEFPNDDFAKYMHKEALKKMRPTMNFEIRFDTQEEVKKAYQILMKDGIILKPLGGCPWNACSAHVIDKYGVYWNLIV